MCARVTVCACVRVSVRVCFWPYACVCAAAAAGMLRCPLCRGQRADSLQAEKTRCANQRRPYGTGKLKVGAMNERFCVHIFNHSKEKSGRKWFNVARWPISPQRFLCGLQGFSINPKKRAALNINSVVCGEVYSPPAGRKQLEASQRSQQAATARLILHVSPPDCLQLMMLILLSVAWLWRSGEANWRVRSTWCGWLCNGAAGWQVCSRLRPHEAAGGQTHCGVFCQDQGGNIVFFLFRISLVPKLNTSCSAFLKGTFLGDRWPTTYFPGWALLSFVSDLKTCCQ